MCFNITVFVTPSKRRSDNESIRTTAHEDPPPRPRPRPIRPIRSNAKAKTIDREMASTVNQIDPTETRDQLEASTEIENQIDPTETQDQLEALTEIENQNELHSNSHDAKAPEQHDNRSATGNQARQINDSEYQNAEIDCLDIHGAETTIDAIDERPHHQDYNQVDVLDAQIQHTHLTASPHLYNIDSLVDNHSKATIFRQNSHIEQNLEGIDSDSLIRNEIRQSSVPQPDTSEEQYAVAEPAELDDEADIDEERIRQQFVYEEPPRFIDDDFDFSLRTQRPARSRLSLNVPAALKLNRPSPKEGGFEVIRTKTAGNRLSKPAPSSFNSGQVISTTLIERPTSSNSNRPLSGRISSLLSPLRRSTSTSTPTPLPLPHTTFSTITTPSPSTQQSNLLPLPLDDLPQTKRGLEARLNMHLQQHADLVAQVKQANDRIRTLQVRADIFFTWHASETPRAAAELHGMVALNRAFRDAHRDLIAFHRGEFRRIYEARKELDRRELKEEMEMVLEIGGGGEGNEKGIGKMPEVFETLPNEFVVEELFRV